jgi:hypothetical protein
MSSHWAIIDIDGTLSDCSARVPLAVAAKQCATPDARSAAWDRFHEDCLSDPAHETEVLLVKAWLMAGHSIAYCTGRPDRYRKSTMLWLRSQGLPDRPLFMRPDSDHRPADILKESFIPVIQGLMRMTDGYVGKIAFALEDQDKIVAMWRRNGITCLQPRAWNPTHSG